MESFLDATATVLAQNGVVGVVAGFCLVALVWSQRQFTAAQTRYIEHLEQAEIQQRRDSQFNRETIQAMIDSLRTHDHEQALRHEQNVGRMATIELHVGTAAAAANRAANHAEAADAAAKRTEQAISRLKTHERGIG